MEIRSVSFLVLFIMLYSCESGEDKSTSGNVKNIITSKKLVSTDFGEKWPFTVSEGFVKCIMGGVIFKANGNDYALNGKAISQKDVYGYSELEEIWAFDEKHTQSLIGMGYSNHSSQLLR